MARDNIKSVLMMLLSPGQLFSWKITTTGTGTVCNLENISQNSYGLYIFSTVYKDSQDE